jgi:hypothetical protein
MRYQLGGERGRSFKTSNALQICVLHPLEPSNPSSHSIWLVESENHLRATGERGGRRRERVEVSQRGKR